MSDKVRFRGMRGLQRRVESLTGREASSASHQSALLISCIPPISVADFMHPTNQRTARDQVVASLASKLSRDELRLREGIVVTRSEVGVRKGKVEVKRGKVEV